jgi:hypothetical protein
MTKFSRALRASTLLAAGLLGAAATASANTFTYDFTTGTPAADQMAYGGTSTALGSQYVASGAISGLAVGDILSASGTWNNNANNGASGATLYYGIFNGPLSSSSVDLTAVAMTCKADNKTSCSTTGNITYTATQAALNYYLVFYSDANNAGDAFKTADGKLTDPPPPSDVPVPGTAALLGLGLVGIGAVRRKRT